VNQAYKQWVFLCRMIFGIVSLMALCMLLSVRIQAEEKRTVAVLPFVIYSLESMDHLKQGLQEMLTLHMAESGLPVINLNVVNQHPMASLPLLEEKDIFSLGKDLGADWLVTGSLTQIGRKISLEVKLCDIDAEKPPFSIFKAEDDTDKVADVVERASASIYNQITGIVKIDSVQVKGNKRIGSEDILAVIESKKGDDFDPDQLNKDLRAILEMGYFTDVGIEKEHGPEGEIVTFTVTEKPSIREISFEGNKKILEYKLNEEVGINLYEILDRSEIRQSVKRLEEYYQKKGYYNVHIEERIDELPDNEVSLTYKINEGEKVYIEKIQFVGNNKFDDDDLKDIMETSEKGFYSWFTNAGLLEKDKLEYDLYKLTSFYNNNGYINAKLSEPEISYNKKEKGLTITISVTEGNQYKVNSIKLEGDLIRSESELLGYIKADEEDSFNREAIYTDVETLKGVYANDGYPYAEVSPVIKEDDENQLVDITYNISKEDRVRFERINITGNTKTRDKVIRRELAVSEGDYYSGKALTKSMENLARLGYFEDVDVQSKKGSQDDLMVLDVNVKEKHTGSLLFGVQYGGYYGGGGYLEVERANLFGRGQKLSISAFVLGRQKDVHIQFIEPWLFNTSISSAIYLYDVKLDYLFYTTSYRGGALGFGFPLERLGLDEYTRGSVQYAYSEYGDTIIMPTLFGWIDMEFKYKTGSVTLGIWRDSKDRPFTTTKGSVNSFSFETAGGFLGGDSGYNKYLVESTWFFPLPRSTVFVARGRWGLINRKADQGLPIYTKFRIGGMDTVRGFEEYSLSPRDPVTGIRIGGEKMMIYNFEYRFPLAGEQGLMGLVFFDAGNVFTKDENFSFSGIRKSAGIGIRWWSPMGPLRIEYGQNLDPQWYESSAPEIYFGFESLF